MPDSANRRLDLSVGVQAVYKDDFLQATHFIVTISNCEETLSYFEALFLLQKTTPAATAAPAPTTSIGALDDVINLARYPRGTFVTVLS